MRIEKIELDRKVGNITDSSWYSLHEGPDTKLTARTRLVGNEGTYKEWNTENKEWNTETVEDPGYIDETEVRDGESDSSEGRRIFDPGTSHEESHSFNLNDEVYEGLLGEIQAAKIYEKVQDLDGIDVGLYDFVEWYQQEDSRTKQNVIEYGESCFVPEDSGITESLEKYLQGVALEGGEIRSGSEAEPIGHIETDRSDSILRQSGLESVDGILTQNPEEVRRRVNQ